MDVSFQGTCAGSGGDSPSSAVDIRQVEDAHGTGGGGDDEGGGRMDEADGSDVGVVVMMHPCPWVRTVRVGDVHHSILLVVDAGAD